MIELYAFGQRLLGDTGMCTYDRKDPAFHWLREMTRSHNTVEVDEKGFPRDLGDRPLGSPYKAGDEEGPCGLDVSSSPRAGFAQGWSGGYPAVRHERDVFFIRETGLCIVRDLLKPIDTKVHTYDQCWHFDPTNHFQSGSCRVWTTNRNAVNLDIRSVVPDNPELLLREGWNMWPRPRTNTIHPSFRQKTAGEATSLNFSPHRLSFSHAYLRISL